jgi:hypothetical protein
MYIVGIVKSPKNNGPPNNRACCSNNEGKSDPTLTHNLLHYHSSKRAVNEISITGGSKILMGGAEGMVNKLH